MFSNLNIKALLLENSFLSLTKEGSYRELGGKKLAILRKLTCEKSLAMKSGGRRRRRRRRRRKRPFVEQCKSIGGGIDGETFIQPKQELTYYDIVL